MKSVQIFLPKRFYLIIWISSLILAGNLASCGTTTSSSRSHSSSIWPEPRPLHHIVEMTDNLESLWVKTNVFVSTNRPYSNPDLAAANGVVFLMGSLSQTENYSLIAFDGTDGTELWQMPGYRSALYATSAALYVGSYLDISAYDLRTGERFWIKRFLPGSAQNIRYIHVENDLLFADPGRTTREYVMDIQTRKRVSASPFGPEYFTGRYVLTQQFIFIRPSSWGEEALQAVDRKTGKVLWQSDTLGPVISNLAATEEAVYMLTEDARLLGLEAHTGEIVASVQFEPGPFITFDPQAQPGGFHLAIDQEEGIIYALLGDSAQLFAFSIVADAGISPD